MAASSTSTSSLSSPSSSQQYDSSSSSSQQGDSSSSSSQQDDSSSASSQQDDSSSSASSQQDDYSSASSQQEDYSSASSQQEDYSSASSQQDDYSPSASSQQDDSSSSSPQDDSSSSSPQDDSSSSSHQSTSSEDDTSSSSINGTFTPPNNLKRKQPMVSSKAAKLPKNFCGICMDTKAKSEMFSNATACAHLFCSDCIRQHVSVKIKENIAKVKCPDPNCTEIIGPEHCRSIIPKEVIERWEDALCESLILGTPKLYCPFKDCSAMLVDDSGEAVTTSECPNCNRLFCAQCKVAWHSGMDCRQFKRVKKEEKNPEDIKLMQLAKNKKWRRCPNCNIYVEKVDGCLHISCRCGYEFCYGCGKKYHSTHACKRRT